MRPAANRRLFRRCEGERCRVLPGRSRPGTREPCPAQPAAAYARASCRRGSERCSAVAALHQRIETLQTPRPVDPTPASGMPSLWSRSRTRDRRLRAAAARRLNTAAASRGRPRTRASVDRYSLPSARSCGTVERNARCACAVTLSQFCSAAHTGRPAKPTLTASWEIAARIPRRRRSPRPTCRVPLATVPRSCIRTVNRGAAVACSMTRRAHSRGARSRPAPDCSPTIPSSNPSRRPVERPPALWPGRRDCRRGNNSWTRSARARAPAIDREARTRACGANRRVAAYAGVVVVDGQRAVRECEAGIQLDRLFERGGRLRVVLFVVRARTFAVLAQRRQRRRRRLCNAFDARTVLSDSPSLPRSACAVRSMAGITSVPSFADSWSVVNSSPVALTFAP